jgi:hypothetical protein
VGTACGTHGRGEKRVQGLGGKCRRKNSTWKAKSCIGEWDKIDLVKIGMWGLEWINWLRVGTVGGLL